MIPMTVFVLVGGLQLAKLDSRGTDELVVEPCDNILELVGSLEGLAGLGPPL